MPEHLLETGHAAERLGANTNTLPIIATSIRIKNTRPDSSTTNIAFTRLLVDSYEGQTPNNVVDSFIHSRCVRVFCPSLRLTTHQRRQPRLSKHSANECRFRLTNAELRPCNRLPSSFRRFFAGELRIEPGTCCPTIRTACNARCNESRTKRRRLGEARIPAGRKLVFKSQTSSARRATRDNNATRRRACSVVAVA